MTHAVWLGKQFLRHMTARHWLISSRRFEEIFLETPDDKRVTFLQNVENPLPSNMICFSRRTQSSFSNMDPKYKVYFLNLTTNLKLSHFSCSCFSKNQYLYRSGQTQKFISLFNQLDTQNLFHNKFYFMSLHVSSTCAHHQEVKIALHYLWYHHTETSEWSKITKIQFYKYEQRGKFMCEFFGCGYCVLLTINMLCHVEVMFIQLLNLLESYYVYLHLCLLSLSSHKIV